MGRAAVRTVAVLGAALAAAGCAGPAGGTAGGPSAATPSPPGVVLPGGDELVLQVAHVGGYVSETTTAARLPLVSVHGDGRVISEGPVAAVWPGPALPNVLVAELGADEVAELVAQALDAGVGEDVDLGTPPVADVPSTRFTVVTAAGVRTSEVYALQAGLFPDGDPPGLTEQQVAGRQRLQAFLDRLTAAAGRATETYVPRSVAAVVAEWVAPDEGLPPQPPVAWPGPPLPGEPLGRRGGVSCVLAAAADAEAVLAAAGAASTASPWTGADGRRWSLVLRPLLPHESGCADLPAT
jgi:hypothetical protein